MVVPATLLALALPFLPGAVSRADDDPLATHRQFVGWSFGDGTFRDMRLTIARKTVEKRDDAEETVEAVISEAHVLARYRSRSERPESSTQSESGFDGGLYWAASINGYVSRFSPATALSKSNLALNEILDEAAAQHVGTARPPAKIGDEDVQVVRVSPERTFPIDLYIDARGAYRRAVIDPDAKTPLTVDIEGYLDVLPGKKIVSKYRVGRSSFEVTKAEPNAGLTAAELRPPAPYPVWTFGGDTVPFQIASSHGGGRAVHVLVSLDGHEGRFILDSGASSILLFSPFGESIGAEKVGTTSYIGINGRRTKSDLLRIKELKIGASALHNVVVEATSLRGLGGADGLLGYDVLATSIVEVDLKSQKLTINDPASYTPKPGEHAAAFPVNRRPFTQVQLPEGANATAVLDTGNDYGVMLSDELRASGRLVTLRANSERFTGADGSGDVALQCVRISRMLVGPYPYENASTCFGSPAAFGASGGLIGFDFLRHFNWTFDYPHGRFILTPNGLN